MLDRLLSLPVIGLLWLIHHLPFRWQTRLGLAFGRLLHLLGRHRRHVVATNLAWCFPGISTVDREKMARQHFGLLGRSLLERGFFWWGTPDRIAPHLHIHGLEKLQAQHDAGRPVILLAPHFVGLDAGWLALTRHFDLVTFYARQGSPTFDALVRAGRSRFGEQQLLSRQDGIRPALRALKEGRPFYYLPDVSGKSKDSIFVPFFGIPTATVTSLPRLAAAAGAVVMPCLTRMLPEDQGYEITLGDPWPDYPTGDIETDTATMNARIEQAVRAMPEQYYWVHRRFKRRPPGEPRPY